MSANAVLTHFPPIAENHNSKRTLSHTLNSKSGTDVRLFVPFIKNSLQFNCAKCGGACCQYGTLPLTINESRRFFKEKPMLKYFINDCSEKYTGISRLSTCWYFNKRKKCSIESNSGYHRKPLFCRSYPFKVLKCHDEYVIHVATLCPSIIFSDKGGDELRRFDVGSAREIIKLGLCKKLNISRKELELEKKIFKCLKNYLGKDSYLEFAVKQKTLSDGGSNFVETARLIKKVNSWMDFLKLENHKLHNQKITYELTGITSILRMLALSLNKSLSPEDLMALYLVMTIYESSRENKKSANPIYVYISLLDFARGLAQFDDCKIIRSKLGKRFTSGKNTTHNINVNFNELIEKTLPSIEQKILFIRQLGDVFVNVDDQLLI